MYAVRIKVNKTLPWIELKRTYTYKEARNTAEDFLNNMQMNIATIPEKGKQARRGRQRKGVKNRESIQREVLSPAFSVDRSYVSLRARANSDRRNLY